MTETDLTDSLSESEQCVDRGRQLDNYRDVLEHVVRPEDPSDREDCTRVRLNDYEALYLYDALVEYAAYTARSREEEQIALGFAEYIDLSVRDERKSLVYLYPHSTVAKAVLIEAAEERSDKVSDLQHGLVENLSSVLD